MDKPAPVSRSLVEAYFKAFSTRDAETLASFFHDDIVWTINGPIDVLPFCGTHYGKRAVLDLGNRKIPSVLRRNGFVQDSILIDGDRVAALSRMTAVLAADGRIVSYRVANFMRFQGDRVIENLSLLDSFDAVEQILGHPLAVHAPALQEQGEVFAI